MKVNEIGRVVDRESAIFYRTLVYSHAGEKFGIPKKSVTACISAPKLRKWLQSEASRASEHSTMPIGMFALSSM